MSPDDIDEVVLKLSYFITDALGFQMDEDDDYSQLSDFMYDQLERFVTRERNFN
jgi:hypothetical protein